jgi:hypothetical protein
VKPLLVAGYMVRYPVGGQLAADFQYVLGLTRMGYDVHYVEEAGWENACFDPSSVSSSDDPSTGCLVVADLFERFGLSGRWTFVDIGRRAHGAPREHVARIAKDAPLINLSDVSWLPEFASCPVRVYVDEDPGFPQMEVARGNAAWRDKLNRYTVHATYGANIGLTGCTIPLAGYDWITTRPPIVMDLWEDVLPPGERWTTVMNWTSYGNVTWNGVEYGQKDREFARVLDLPGRTRECLEVALNGPPEVRETLRRNGWWVSEALAASRTFETYRDYIAGSRGEVSVAKHGYVATSSGWFSDRSAAYLASGRPVILQETGFSRHLPTGAGLLTFSDAPSAAAALEQVTRDLPYHAAAARSLAAEHFAYEGVLGRLLEKAGIA